MSREPDTHFHREMVKEAKKLEPLPYDAIIRQLLQKAVAPEIELIEIPESKVDKLSNTESTHLLDELSKK